MSEAVYCVHICIYSKTSSKSTDHRTDLNGRFREVVDLRSYAKLRPIVWDPYKAINKRRWSICGDGRLERFDCIYIGLRQMCTIYKSYIHMYKGYIYYVCASLTMRYIIYLQ